MATVQSTDGGVVLSRSADDGASWDDRLLKAPRGYSFSAADVVLMDGGKAMITYVKERVRRSRLLATEVVSRWSPDDGISLRRAQVGRPGGGAAAHGAQHRQHRPAGHHRPAVGPAVRLDRNLYVTRLR